PPVLHAAEHAADNLRPHDSGGLEHVSELFFRRAGLGFEHLRSRADRFHPDLDLDVKFFGMLADFAQVPRVETPDESNLRKMDYFGFLLRAIIQELEGRPDLRPQAEEIDAKFHRKARVRR